jgi:hypothetical protein
MFQTNLSVLLVHAGKVDLGNEMDTGRLVGVVGAAVDLETVDTVLMRTLWRTLGLSCCFWREKGGKGG